MSTAREQILARIRKALAPAHHSGEAAQAPLPTSLPPPDIDPLMRRRTFLERLRSVGGEVHEVKDLGDAARVLTELVVSRQVTSLAISDDGLVAALHAVWQNDPRNAAVRWLRAPVERTELLSTDLGLTSAQYGIAETGSVVLLSDREQHRWISLLPAIHVVLLPAASILDNLDQILAASETNVEALATRAVTIISGPSRTADIELTLVIGVHGPKELHVLLLDSPSSESHS